MAEKQIYILMRGSMERNTPSVIVRAYDNLHEANVAKEKSMLLSIRKTILKLKT